MKELAPMQKRVYDIIAKGIEARGKAPAYRTIADILGVAHNAVAGHVARLEKKGYIWREDGEIRLLKRDSSNG